MAGFGRGYIMLAMSVGLISSQINGEDTTARNEVHVETREALIRALDTATPGTTVLIAAGEYRGGIHVDELVGTAQRPIIVRGANPEQPPVFRGGTSGFQLRAPQYVHLENLVIEGASGNGLNIDDGGDGRPTAHHITLNSIQVRKIGPRGNHDGIKLSGLNDFVVTDCQISEWGEAGSAIDMVGCHQGLIQGCQLQFRSDVLASGIQTKGGSSNITIQRCRFDNAGNRAVNIGGSTGLPYFRPLDAPYEAKNITVEDCTFIGSPSPIAFVGVDGAVVRYNTIYRPRRWVMRILQESQDARFVQCRRGEFTNNIIAFRSDELQRAINIGPKTEAETFQFSGNYWYCLDQPDRSVRIALPVPETNGVAGVDPQFRAAETGDLRLLPVSKVNNAGVRPL